jgi:predicted ATP-grasp superfamily ATP-dependent carboligase
LDRRGTPYVRLLAEEHFYGPGEKENIGLVFNRMSPSAYRREHGSGILYTLNYLEHLESNGIPVINGTRAFRHEISKALQLTMLDRLRLPFPKARVIHRSEEAVDAAQGLRFPIVVKPNVGGSGAGVVRFDSLDELRRRTSHDTLDFGLDSVGLVQEFIPARGGHITRVEVLDGKFLYAIKVFLTGETFDLCPADICRTTEGVALENSCPVEAPKAGLRVEGYTPPPDVIQAVERIMSEAGIEVGGVEYIIDDRDGQLYYYDVNALSNFVAGAEQVVGFNPFSRLVDFRERRAADGRR